MAPIREAYELEPGEIPPFPIRYCQTDELEPGEIRPYPPLRLQTSPFPFQPSEVQVLTQHLQVQHSAETFQSSAQSSHVQVSGNAFQTMQVQSSAHSYQFVEVQSSAQSFQSSQVQASHPYIQPSQVQSSSQSIQPSQASAHSNGVRRIHLLRRQTCWENQISQSQNLQEALPTSKGENYKIKKLEGLLFECKNTLKNEREAFAVKLKRKSRKIKDLEIKTKFQQNEQKDVEVSKARELNEKNAFLLESKSENLAIAEERIDLLESDIAALRKKNGLAVKEISHCKTTHEKTMKKLRKEKKSLTQQSELWTTKFRQVKDEQATMSEQIKTLRNKYCRRGKIIEAEKATNAELLKNMAALKQEMRLLSQENGFLKEENYNLRYYGGVAGTLRRVKRFLGRLADRLSM